MFTHSVMFKLKDGAELGVHEVASALKGLEADVPECVSVSVALNESTSPAATDLLFIAEFASAEDYQSYRVHPEHIRVVEQLHGSLGESVHVDHTGAWFEIAPRD